MRYAEQSMPTLPFWLLPPSDSGLRAAIASLLAPRRLAPGGVKPDGETQPYFLLGQPAEVDAQMPYRPPTRLHALMHECMHACMHARSGRAVSPWGALATANMKDSHAINRSAPEPQRGPLTLS